ncbi:hypothetical protein B0H11DRAFT_2268634 [Mycena galericulata]|nr:hypothetical protein B0H11DRAFT_2268634 [Mycena galericulata]
MMFSLPNHEPPAGRVSSTPSPVDLVTGEVYFGFPSVLPRLPPARTSLALLRSSLVSLTSLLPPSAYHTLSLTFPFPLPSPPPPTLRSPKLKRTHSPFQPPVGFGIEAIDFEWETTRSSPAPRVRVRALAARTHKPPHATLERQTQTVCTSAPAGHDDHPEDAQRLQSMSLPAALARRPCPSIRICDPHLAPPHHRHTRPASPACGSCGLNTDPQIKATRHDPTRCKASPSASIAIDISRQADTDPDECAPPPPAASSARPPSIPRPRTKTLDVRPLRLRPRPLSPLPGVTRRPPVPRRTPHAPRSAPRTPPHVQFPTELLAQLLAQLLALALALRRRNH